MFGLSTFVQAQNLIEQSSFGDPCPSGIFDMNGDCNADVFGIPPFAAAPIIVIGGGIVYRYLSTIGSRREAEQAARAERARLVEMENKNKKP